MADFGVFDLSIVVFGELEVRFGGVKFEAVDDLLVFLLFQNL